MPYCEKCMLLVEGEGCPRCGAGNLRAAKEDDAVFLVARDAFWSGEVEAILQENGIPCLKRGAQGAGITAKAGELTEEYSFYVPYSALQRARELLAGISVEG